MAYTGGKGAEGVAQTIINEQPPHETYVEPFLGAGAILRAKRPARFNMAFDLDPAAIALNADLQIPHLHIYRRCGIAFLETDARTEDATTLIYLDPPYPFEVRSRQRRLYRYELEDVDHRRLLRAALALKCMVQISSYWSSLYAEMLEGWRLIRFQAATRGGLREECLWMNYPKPAALHDYRFLGRDFRDRDRIKQKIQRWRSRIASLPALERAALISAITYPIDAAGDTSDRDEASRREPAASSMLDRPSAEMVASAV